MKKTLLIIGGIVLAGGAFVAYRMMTSPRIDIESVDFGKKTVRYEMKAKGVMKGGTINLGDSGSTGGGGYELAVSSTNDSMYFKIIKNGKVVKKASVNFKTERISR